MRKFDVFGISYAATDYAGATEAIIERARGRQNYAVFALPVHALYEIRQDLEFKAAMKQADLILPDGQPIKWAMNYFHNAKLNDRVYGPELMKHILSRANEERLRIFLYGGSTVKVQERLVEYINENFPNAIICGVFREESADTQTLTPSMVNEKRPNILFVGLGCPNQEKWIAQCKDEVDAPMIGVGAAFSFYAGDVKMAPMWMQDRGLEWLFRLISEPRRLWRRYLTTNTYFVYLVAKRVFSNLFRLS